MNGILKIATVSVATILLGGMSIHGATAGEVKASYLHNLSSFSGPVPFSFVNISVDKNANEIYVIDRRENTVGIFDEHGMETYRFGDDGRLGQVFDVAVNEDGNFLVLASGVGARTQIRLCNFRGEPLSNIVFQDLPEEFAGFSPDRIVYRKGRLYLAETGSMRIVVTDDKGRYQKGYDAGTLLGLDEKARKESGIDGFSLDSEGNILLTSALLFSAFRLSPDGVVTSFGERGSAPGKFGIVGDIVSDERGSIYIADRLRSVVLIFNRDLQFQSEFGYRGYRPENLIAPKALAVDAAGNLYVSQLQTRGVSVFRITYN